MSGADKQAFRIKGGQVRFNAAKTLRNLSRYCVCSAMSGTDIAYGDTSYSNPLHNVRVADTQRAPGAETLYGGSRNPQLLEQMLDERVCPTLVTSLLSYHSPMPCPVLTRSDPGHVPLHCETQYKKPQFPCSHARYCLAQTLARAPWPGPPIRAYFLRLPDVISVHSKHRVLRICYAVSGTGVNMTLVTSLSRPTPPLYNSRYK
eukprot:3355925-Rhodomonas_salina.1